jgi:hypothetical protein
MQRKRQLNATEASWYRPLQLADSQLLAGQTAALSDYCLSCLSTIMQVGISQRLEDMSGSFED